MGASCKKCVDCDHFLPVCKMRGEIKGFNQNSGCDGSGFISKERFPTLGELIDVYYPKYAERNFLRTSINGKIGKPRKNTRKINMHFLKHSMQILGVTRDDRICDVDKKRLVGIIDWYVKCKQQAENDPSVKVFSESTVMKLLECWKNVTSKWMREFAEDDGMIINAIDLPAFTCTPKEWKKPTKMQELNYKKWVEELSKEKSIDWAMLIFQRATGCRNGDVNAAKWENFKIKDGKCYYTYTDSKTQKESDQVLPIELMDILLRWRNTNFNSKRGAMFKHSDHADDPYIFGGKKIMRTDGTYYYAPTRHAPVWRRLNKGIKKTGICDFRTDGKGMYQQRAMRGNEIREKYGEEAMNHVLHNSRKVSGNYSSFNTSAMNPTELIA